MTQYTYRRSALGAFMVILLGLSSLSASPADSATPPAQGDEVRVIVKGVAVPYSVFGIIKHLEQIPGVAKVDFDMRHGLADIKLIPGAHITEDQLRAAIKNASYTPGDIHWVTPK
jgi:copper chaperone CopZ